MAMDVWVVRTLNQQFVRGSYTEIKFSKKKKKAVSDKTTFFLIGPFYTPDSNIGFESLTGQFCIEMLHFQSCAFN